MSEPNGRDSSKSEQEKSRKTRHVAAFMAGVLGTALVLIQLFTILAIRNTQTEGSPTQMRLVALAEQIRSCTDPAGECYQRGQASTAKAIVGINEGTLRVIVAALSCQADGVTEQPALSRCTIERSTP